MSYEGPYLDWEVARGLGVLQEINRLLLHPRGLALQIDVQEDGETAVCKIWDSREDPEGIHYEEVDLVTGASQFQQILDNKSEDRMAALGYIVQPTRGSPPEMGPVATAPDVSGDRGTRVPGVLREQE